MNCRECNESIPENAKFCGKCGCAVHTEKSEAYTSDNEQVKPEQEAIDSHESDSSFPENSSKVKKKKALIIAVSLVLVVALVVSGVVFIPKYIEKKRQQEIWDILEKMSCEYAEGNYAKAKEFARKLPDSDKVKSYTGVIEFYEEMDGWSGSAEQLLECFADFCAEAENWSFYTNCSTHINDYKVVGSDLYNFDFNKINTQLIPGLRREYKTATLLDLAVKSFCNNFICGAVYYPNSVDMDQLCYSTLKELNSLNTEDGICTVEEAITIVDELSGSTYYRYNEVGLSRFSFHLASDNAMKAIGNINRYGCEVYRLDSEEYEELSMTTYVLVCLVTRLIGEVDLEIYNDSGSQSFEDIFNDVYYQYFPDEKN